MVEGELPPDICQLKNMFGLDDGSIAVSHAGEIIIGGCSKLKYRITVVIDIGMGL